MILIRPAAVLEGAETAEGEIGSAASGIPTGAPQRRQSTTQTAWSGWLRGETPPIHSVASILPHTNRLRTHTRRQCRMALRIPAPDLMLRYVTTTYLLVRSC